MYVNGIPFLIMISRKSAQALPDENISLSTLPYKRLSRSTRTMVLLSHTYLEMGNWENGHQQDIARCTLNIVPNNEHVPEVEFYIRTIKERTQSVYNSHPFKKFPNWLLIEIVYAQVFWLNAFPSNNGISTLSSPCNIVTGLGIDYNLHCKWILRADTQ